MKLLKIGINLLKNLQKNKCKRIKLYCPKCGSNRCLRKKIYMGSFFKLYCMDCKKTSEFRIIEKWKNI